MRGFSANLSMKKLLIGLLFLLFLYKCVSHKNGLPLKYGNNLRSLNLNGKISKMIGDGFSEGGKEKNCFIFDSYGNLTEETTRSLNDSLLFKFKLVYRNKKLIKQISIYYDTLSLTDTSYTTFKHYTNGNIIEAASFKNEILLGKEIYVYNSKNILTEELTVFSIDKNNLKTKHEYNSKKQLVRSNTYRNDTVLYYFHAYVHDRKGRMKQDKYCSPKGEILNKSEYTYDKRNNLIQSKDFYPLEDTVNIFNFYYVYDNHKNWIIRYSSGNNGYRDTLKRFIEYSK